MGIGSPSPYLCQKEAWKRDSHIKCRQKSESLGKYYRAHSKDRKDKYNDEYMEKDKDKNVLDF